MRVKEVVCQGHTIAFCDWEYFMFHTTEKCCSLNALCRRVSRWGPVVHDLFSVRLVIASTTLTFSDLLIFCNNGCAYKLVRICLCRATQSFFVAHFCRHNGIREHGLYHYNESSWSTFFHEFSEVTLPVDTVNNNWSAGLLYIETWSGKKHSSEYDMCGIFRQYFDSSMLSFTSCLVTRAPPANRVGRVTTRLPNMLPPRGVSTWALKHPVGAV